MTHQFGLAEEYDVYVRVNLAYVYHTGRAEQESKRFSSGLGDRSTRENY